MDGGVVAPAPVWAPAPAPPLPPALQLVVVGASQQSAPLAVRERLAIAPAEARAALAQLRDTASAALALSTCNRVEVYALTADGDPGPAQRFLAARAGVLGLTRTLALEWASDGIALNCIGPGAVLTEGLAGEAATAMLDRLVAATPMGRATSVEEVAELVAFLASPAGHLMTGQLIQIDGAAHLGTGLHMLEPQFNLG